MEYNYSNYEVENAVKDYLWLFKYPSINNKRLLLTCYEVEKELKEKFPPIGDNKYGCFSSYYHTEYNLFSFQCQQLQKLYTILSFSINKIIDPEEQYYVRCWVNLFAQEKNIGWHSHWEPEFKTYHGFYCVHTEGKHDSYTDYKLPNKEDVLRITSKDGLCVFGKSDGDKHRSSPWLNENHRVTIAFDIIPVGVLRRYHEFTHIFLHNYIPLYKT